VNTAVIDIGTNTLLLLVVDPQMKPLVDLCRFGRLGKGLDRSGQLAPDAIATSLEICREYRQVMDEHGVDRPVVIGTQALREASNSRAFVEPAEHILGASIEIIAGTREADLAFTAVARTFPDLAGNPCVVVDVGGGSTELITSDGARVVSAVSVPIGAVRLTERHLAHDPPTVAEADALTADIDAVLAPLVLPTGVPVVATAGTATTIAAVQLALRTYDPVAVTGLRISPDTIDAMLQRLLAATVAERKQIPGIEPQRADVIAAGVAIYARVVKRLGAPTLITCDRGIRWGIAYERAAIKASRSGS
jgi:exopolyphosphatase / guanosine-5'-triphosphate,3'-diphosphate pyrophosphatase